MVKIFFNIIIPLAAAVTLLLILFAKIDKGIGNHVVALLFGIFIVNFGYKGFKENTMMNYISIFYIVAGIAIVIVNSWFLWRLI